MLVTQQIEDKEEAVLKPSSSQPDLNKGVTGSDHVEPTQIFINPKEESRETQLQSTKHVSVVNLNAELNLHANEEPEAGRKTEASDNEAMNLEKKDADEDF